MSPTRVRPLRLFPTGLLDLFQRALPGEWQGQMRKGMRLRELQLLRLERR